MPLSWGHVRASALPYVMYDGLLHRWGFVGGNQLGVCPRDFYEST